MIHQNNNFGFTLVELMVATGVFLVVVTMSTSIFVTVSRTQKQTQATQTLQSDVSYAFEKIARQLRFGSISYEGVLSGASSRIQIIDTQGRRVVFTTDPVADCENDSHDECIRMGVDLNADGNVSPSEFTYLTPNSMRVRRLRFFVSPSVDPFKQVSSGVYQSNIQPRTTLVLEAEKFTSDASERQTIILQTTILSRVYER